MSGIGAIQYVLGSLWTRTNPLEAQREVFSKLRTVGLFFVGGALDREHGDNQKLGHRNESLLQIRSHRTSLKLRKYDLSWKAEILSQIILWTGRNDITVWF